MNTKHIQHLYWRAGFGISPKQLQFVSNKNKNEIVTDLFNASEKVTSLHVDTSEFDNLSPEKLLKNTSFRRKLIKKSREKLIEFNYAWIERFTNPKELLREKMTLFWANHFVCQDDNIIHVQQYNNTLRTFALGDFRTFVKAVSKEAAMIKYLNLKQNRKLKPNENFARELMELFTLGVGHYSEIDIKESARAFTGYNHNFEGDFLFRKRQHDYDTKIFLGKTGNFNGDDIIDIILEQKQCAKFICEKIYSYFVNENVVSKHIDEMVNVFYPNYNIEKLMRFVFLSDWFYNADNIGTKIKSPIEFLVGIHNTVPISFTDPKTILQLQKLLGQVLLKPPNVAGWKGGKSWVDTNTIMIRLKLPSLLLNDSKIPITEKGGFNDSFYNSKSKMYSNILKTEANWSDFNKNYALVKVGELQEHIIQCEINSNTKLYLGKLLKTSKKTYCVQLMSLPEYQMC